MEHCPSGHPLDMVRLEEPVDPLLPALVLVRQPQPLQESQLLLPLFLKSLLAQPEDLAAAHLEDLADSPEGHVCGVLVIGDEFAVPDLDHVVDLRLAELLHLF